MSDLQNARKLVTSPSGENMNATEKKQPYWKSKQLHEMSHEEWEALCDGCALCCLHKIEDEETLEVFYTSVVCHLLDKASCQCSQYQSRTTRVPSCLKLKPEDVVSFTWLPPSCAYRLVHEKKDLPSWHPLVTSDPASVMRSGHSVLNVYEVTDQEITEDEMIEFVMEEGIIFRG